MYLPVRVNAITFLAVFLPLLASCSENPTSRSRADNKPSLEPHPNVVKRPTVQNSRENILQLGMWAAFIVADLKDAEMKRNELALEEAKKNTDAELAKFIGLTVRWEIFVQGITKEFVEIGTEGLSGLLPPDKRNLTLGLDIGACAEGEPVVGKLPIGNGISLEQARKLSSGTRVKFVGKVQFIRLEQHFNGMRIVVGLQGKAVE